MRALLLDVSSPLPKQYSGACHSASSSTAPSSKAITWLVLGTDTVCKNVTTEEKQLNRRLCGTNAVQFGCGNTNLYSTILQPALHVGQLMSHDHAKLNGDYTLYHFGCQSKQHTLLLRKDNTELVTTGTFTNTHRPYIFQLKAADLRVNIGEKTLINAKMVKVSSHGGYIKHLKMILQRATLHDHQLDGM
uniref:Uncharacterized protein n=1 Tax=Oryza brachyantha TaxID=4533 RepID=J3LUS7_ORYBR